MSPSDVTPDNRPEHPRTLLLCPGTTPEMREIAVHLGHFGYQCERVDSIPELAMAVDSRPPSAMILDCGALCRLVPETAALLQALAARIPLICLSGDGRIETRLEAVRMGCAAFFPRPMDVSVALDTLDRLTTPNQVDTGSILIIDDSPSQAAFYAAHLGEAGFTTRVLTEPLKTLEVLADGLPDLILLDMHMPDISGSEVAKLLRQQDTLVSIPIVFLSAETDVDRQLAAMSQGGDEFLRKPIKPAHLVSAVRTRVARYRALRALMLRDSLTGLLNHTSFKERLHVETARHNRLGKHLAVGLLDIDDFKSVNDTHGHPVGDRVIKNLARLLIQRAGSGSILGRYGGEEFAMVLPDTSLEDARSRLESIRSSFATIEQQTGRLRFNCTFSCGLAGLSRQDDAEALIMAADQALYRAKRGGKNRVEIAGGAD